MSSKKQTSKKSEKQPKLADTSINSQKDNQIREVYIDNFTQEIKTLSRLIEKYNYIAMVSNGFHLKLRFYSLNSTQKININLKIK
jgi:hypothetical protein